MARILTFASVALTLAVSSGVQGQVSFLPPQTLDSGTNTKDVQIADLNGDSLLDIVAANRGEKTVSVFLATGGGSFAAASTITVSSAESPRPFALAIADLDQDTNLDLAVVLEGDDAVAILLGNGDGTFGAATRFSIRGTQTQSLTPEDIVVADLNNDTFLDLATANANDNDAAVLLNDGSGSFTLQADVPAGREPSAVGAGDFDGDGNVDLVVANYRGTVGQYDSSVTVVFGQGTGAFSDAVSLEVASGARPAAVAVADLNADSHPDIITANAIGDSVSVLLGNGDRTFAAHTEYSAGNRPSDVRVVDLDGDGRLDLVTANFEGDTVSVLIAQADGSFAPPLEFDANGGPAAVAVGNLNGDADLDLAVANEETDGLVSVLLAGQLPQHTLSVQSTPFTGVTITADPSSAGGTTDYSVQIAETTRVTLTALENLTVDGTDYQFTRWTLNGTDQADGQEAIIFTISQDTTAVATYDVAPARGVFSFCGAGMGGVLPLLFLGLWFMKMAVRRA